MKVPIAFSTLKPQQGQSLQELLALSTAKLLSSQSSVLASAARTTSVTSANFINEERELSCWAFLKVTAASGTGGLRVYLQAIDPYGGGTFLINAFSTTVLATGTYGFLFSPWVTTGLLNWTGSGYAYAHTCVIPNLFAFYVNAVDASSYTYQLNAVFC